MQGQEQGEHPSTAVQTVAEKAKFEREALMYLITPEQRRELGGLSHTQVIDVNRWAVRWNEDVGRTERRQGWSHGADRRPLQADQPQEAA